MHRLLETGYALTHSGHGRRGTVAQLETSEAHLLLLTSMTTRMTRKEYARLTQPMQIRQRWVHYSIYPYEYFYYDY
jgi:hypothetical protein